jgi:hypothetical protein
MPAAISERFAVKPIHAAVGTEERIRELQRRVRRRERLDHPDDCRSMDWLPPGAVQPPCDGSPLHRRGRPGQTGVERQNFAERYSRPWRCRPYWRGKKHDLGWFATRHEAIRRAEAFWRETLGLFWQCRSKALSWMKPLKQLEESPEVPAAPVKPKRQRHSCLFCSLGLCGNGRVMRAAARKS